MKNNIISIIAKGFLYIIFTYTFSFLALNSFSQGVSINTSGAAADNSAALDVSSTTQGALIPRMTNDQRNTIDNPAQGLMIYNITSKCFEIYESGFWQTVTCNCTSAPAAAGTISGTATVCPGQMQFYSIPAISNATNYIWSYSGTGASIVGSTNNVIIHFSGTATSGNLTVMGTNACGNGTVSGNYALDVNSNAPNITAQPASIAVCTDTGTPSFIIIATGGITYQWQEYISSWNNVSNGGVYSGANTATLTITNPPIGMNAYKYRCIISGACSNTTSDGLATLTVNPIPTASISGTTTVCQNVTAPNITFTNPQTLPVTITYNINGSNQTTVNVGANTTTTVAVSITTVGTYAYNLVSIVYQSAPTCSNTITGTATVTVNPTPSISSAATGTICSGVAQNYSITSPVGGATYSWSRALVTGISNSALSGQTNNPITETLTNTTAAAVNVIYLITPTANSCSGSQFTYTVMINPTPTVAIIPATQTVCSGIAIAQITLSNPNSVPGNTTYSWTRDNTTNTTGITTPGSGNITGTLTNTTTTQQNTIFTGTATSQYGCPSNTNTATVTVNPPPYNAGGVTTTTTCNGIYTVVSFTCTNSTTSGSTTWTVPTGVTSVEYLVVAGGGGGYRNGGGGGGAGGFLTATDFAVSGNMLISIGAGGIPGNNGSNSIFGVLGGTEGTNLFTAIGGGAGGGDGANAGGSGGGGGRGTPSTAGSGTTNQGHSGGNGYTNMYGAGGGGGGANNTGGTATNTTTGGAGGAGLPSSISGTTTYYAGGGGGGANTSPGAGGIGGGGNGSLPDGPAYNGAANSGGGGGGCGNLGSGDYPGSGGSGIIIIRF